MQVKREEEPASAWRKGWVTQFGPLKVRVEPRGVGFVWDCMRPVPGAAGSPSPAAAKRGYTPRPLTGRLATLALLVGLGEVVKELATLRKASAKVKTLEAQLAKREEQKTAGQAECKKLRKRVKRAIKILRESDWTDENFIEEGLMSAAEEDEAEPMAVAAAEE